MPMACDDALTLLWIEIVTVTIGSVIFRESTRSWYNGMIRLARDSETSRVTFHTRWSRHPEIPRAMTV